MVTDDMWFVLLGAIVYLVIVLLLSTQENVVPNMWIALYYVIAFVISAIIVRVRKKRIARQKEKDLLAGNYRDIWEYKQFVRLWLIAKEYQDVQIIKRSDTYGADIICKDVQGNRIAVHCELCLGSVEYSTVEGVHRAMHYNNCNRAMLVTNSTYEYLAVKAASEVGVELWGNVISMADTPWHYAPN